MNTDWTPFDPELLPRTDHSIVVFVSDGYKPSLMIYDKKRDVWLDSAPIDRKHVIRQQCFKKKEFKLIGNELKLVSDNLKSDTSICLRPSKFFVCPPTEFNL
jgi:hypothetical protein